MGKFKLFLPASRGRFFLAVMFAAGLLFPPRSSTQTEIKIIGLVVDRLAGSPIPGVTVSLQQLGKFAVSDSRGEFNFTDIPDGDYTLIAGRIGYFDSAPVNIRTGEASSARVTITLLPNPILIPGQTITAPAISDINIKTNGNITTIDIPPGSLASIETLAKQIPALDIVDSGSRKLLRLRGSQTNAVVIMLDGRIQNSSLLSTGDISAIPLSSVTRVEIVTGGGYASDGLAGSVNFITNSTPPDASIKASVQRGSFGFESYTAGLRSPRKSGIDAGLDFGNSYYRGNFRFTDPRDSIEIRQNNFTHDINFLATAAGLFQSPKLVVKARYFKRDAGVPGPVFQPTPQAQSNMRESEIYATVASSIGNVLWLSAIGGISSRTSNYNSPQTPTNFIPYKTAFDENSRDIRLQFQTRATLDFNLYGVLRYETLNGRDYIRPSSSFGRHSRTTNTLGAGFIAHLPRFALLDETSTLNLGLKHEAENGNGFWGPSSTLRLNFSLPAEPGIDVSWYRSQRFPGMTDLYWKEDVFATPNPDLKPEKSAGYDIGFDLHSHQRKTWELRISRYQTKFDDIIIWRKWGGDKFKPVNLSSADISGWELSFSASPWSGPLSFFYNANFMRPLNKENDPLYRNKYLTFRPIVTQNTGFELSVGDLKLELSGRHLGRRFMTEENTKSLPPLDLLDLNFNYGSNLKSLVFKTSFSILNLGNKEYEILERQPEKPREYHIKLTLWVRRTILFSDGSAGNEE